jgi:hypothetical protein
MKRKIETRRDRIKRRKSNWIKERIESIDYFFDDFKQLTGFDRVEQ